MATKVMRKYEAHPLAERFPMMAGEEWEGFKVDIQANGLREPITLCRGKVLDGRNRLRACEETGTAPRFEEFQGTEVEARAFVRSKNLHRRHLTTEFRRELVAELRAEGKSVRAIAKELEIDPKQVRRDLKASGGDSVPTCQVTGLDGKKYAATKPAPTAADDDGVASDPDDNPYRTRPAAPRAEGVRDDRGRLVPTKLADQFEAGRRFNAAVRDTLTELHDLFQAAQTEPWGMAIGGTLQAVEIDAKNIKEAARCAVPYCCCPHLLPNGDHQIQGKCRVCQDRGWLTKNTHEQLTADLRNLCDSYADATPSAEAA